MNELESALASAARRGVVAGANPESLVRNATQDVLEERLESRGRQVFAHVLMTSPRDAWEFGARWAAAAQQVDLVNIAESLAVGGVRSMVRVREPGLDLDADLLGGGR